MFTLDQSLNAKGHAGDPLPTVWEALEKKGTQLLRGQLCLICAGPGVGKSAFMLTYALKSQVPTFYFSADSDPFTQLSRSLSILTGMTMDKTTGMVRAGNLGEVDFTNIPIRFNYNASPDLKELKQSLMAYEEVYGDYPDLVVVDNVTNVRTGGENDANPYGGLEMLMDELHKLARDTGSCVVGLHHVTGDYNDSDKVIPLSGVKGQITRVPELVLTLHKVADDFGPAALMVSTVKNRAGWADPSGYNYTELEFTGETMQIKDRRD